jgi:DNA invertase Pin-like site-specific DNA recombinase
LPICITNLPSVPPPLWDTHHLDALLVARRHVLLAEEAAIRSVQFGDVTEGLPVAYQRENHMLFVDGISIQHAILRDQAARAFGEEDLVAELDRRLHLTALDEVRVGLKNRGSAMRKNGRRLLTDIPERASRAAQYVRMSTDHGKYSTQNQAEAIAACAERRGLTIVRSYADEGRSGLDMDGRQALQDLIGDVKSGRADFECILVYDVSRWGRFQDADESAYCEFICKEAGVRVHYCAELFENDGSLTATILKNLKRAMAGEFSRELSVKVFMGQSRITRMGFWRGGAPGLASGVSAVTMVLPMQLMAGMGRAISPVSGVIIAVSKAGECLPFEIVGRTILPSIGGMDVTDQLFPERMIGGAWPLRPIRCSGLTSTRTLVLGDISTELDEIRNERPRLAAPVDEGQRCDQRRRIQYRTIDNAFLSDFPDRGGYQ